MSTFISFNLAPPETICQLLGQRLRALRHARGFPQLELAARAGVSTGTVRTLEHTGLVSLDSFVRIATALGAVGELEPLFAAPPTSIADLERVANKRPRQRVRQKTP